MNPILLRAKTELAEAVTIASVVEDGVVTLPELLKLKLRGMVKEINLKVLVPSTALFDIPEFSDLTDADIMQITDGQELPLEIVQAAYEAAVATYVLILSVLKPKTDSIPPETIKLPTLPPVIDAPELDDSKEDSSKEDSSKENSSKEDSSKEDSSKEDSSKEDSSKEVSSTENVEESGKVVAFAGSAVETIKVESNTTSRVEDDLTIINGVGPALANALQNVGIAKISALALSDVNSLSEVLKEQNLTPALLSKIPSVVENAKIYIKDGQI